MYIEGRQLVTNSHHILFMFFITFSAKTRKAKKIKWFLKLEDTAFLTLLILWKGCFVCSLFSGRIRLTFCSMKILWNTNNLFVEWNNQTTTAFSHILHICNIGILVHFCKTTDLEHLVHGSFPPINIIFYDSLHNYVVVVNPVIEMWQVKQPINS